MDTVIPLRNTVYFIYSVTVFILQSAVYIDRKNVIFLLKIDRKM